MDNKITKISVKFKSKKFDKVRIIAELLKAESEIETSLDLSGHVFRKIVNAYNGNNPIIKQNKSKFVLSFPVLFLDGVERIDEDEEITKLAYDFFVDEDVDNEELETIEKNLINVMKSNKLINVIGEISKAFKVSYEIILELESYDEKEKSYRLKLKESKNGKTSLFGSAS